jgi:O-antigen/teichoic acid export membrane protein
VSGAARSRLRLRIPLDMSRNWLPPWLRSWATDSIALLFSQFAAVVATSALAILLARHLGPKDWGLFSGFLGLSLALSIFVEFGLTQWLLRELSGLWAGNHGEATSPHRAGRLVVSSLAVNAALGSPLIVGTVAATIALGVKGSSTVLLVALVVYGALLAVAGGLETVFRARRRLARVVGATLLEKGLLLLLAGLSLALGFGLTAIAVAYVVAAIARVLFDIGGIARQGDVRLTAPSIGSMKHVIRESLPFAINRASLNVVPQLDTLVLAALSPIAAGYFALGGRALGPVLIIPAVLSSALYPFLARESAGSRAGWRVVALLALGGTVVGAVGIAVTPRLIPLVFGSNYAHAIHVVQVMLLAIPFVFAANPLLVHLYTERLEQRSLGLRLIGVSIFGTGAIVAGQVLVGPVGAAGGFVVRSALFVGTLVVAGRASVFAAASGRRAGADPWDGDAPSESSPVASTGSLA